jgi:site-specific DNA-methyltransferase (cytosine-N4-specific)
MNGDIERNQHECEAVGDGAARFENTVFIGDSRQMSELPDESVHLVVTSPPYFNIKDYSKDGHQQISHSRRNSAQLGDMGTFEQFLGELASVWRECERALAPNGKLVINSPLVPMTKAQLTTHENRHIYDLNSGIQETILKSIPNLFLLDTYIWNRTNPSKRLMFGSYPHPTNFYAQNTIEFVTVYVKGGNPRRVAPQTRRLSALTQSEWIDYTKQVWDLPIPNKSDSAFGKHTALMPEAIVERCVRLFSFVGDIVLDPFAGSGTTLKVAKQLGRRFVGYELVASYQGIINEKIGGDVCRKAVRNTSRQVTSASAEISDQRINEVVHRDAITFLKSLPRHTVDMICVDPPYNLGKGPWDSFPSRESFLTFTRSWLAHALPVLVPGGSLYVFNTPENAAHILVYCQTFGLEFRNWITWDKRDGFVSTKSRFVPAQETILYFVKPGAPPTFNSDAVRHPYDSQQRIAAAAKKGIIKNGKRWFPNPAGKLCTDVWHIVSERHRTKVNGKTQRTPHPTQKPLELIERIILASTNPNDLVLDFFAGSGTTAVAAIDLGRRFLGCDSDAKYVEIANDRIVSIGGVMHPTGRPKRKKYAI